MSAELHGNDQNALFVNLLGLTVALNNSVGQDAVKKHLPVIR